MRRICSERIFGKTNNRGALQVEAAIYYPIVMIFVGIIFLLAILKCGNTWKTYYAKEEEFFRWEHEMGKDKGYRWLDEEKHMREYIMSGWSTNPSFYPALSGGDPDLALYNHQSLPFLNDWRSERYQSFRQYHTDSFELLTQEEYVNYSATLYSLRWIREEAKEDE